MVQIETDTEAMRNAGTSVQARFQEVVDSLARASSTVVALTASERGPNADALQTLSQDFHTQIRPAIDTLNQIGATMGIAASTIDDTVASLTRMFTPR